ncbi:hypothetical protein BBO99_00007840 [Phytophthora kernoviae]|uniref:Fascin domain-containing protein n=2 Tax=Phytophthora kernoviae TaxID=325452 RepID=A0A3R7HT34_9STRA|nr:hypothetical protein G195_009104 [Phytophthora kernoviae 00238/432]KAG2516476.1 hypothetical protein JM16_007652 [Phytophthora kernoviae]KAG2519500.1 hypothetical protein JM18_006978 [Phytophthora kernoviae]RLN38022.1 hypothetical protein BBI17_007881 [Phytophthora kernoviae]RLN76073.1 hypothetical protein BBO99_00007840 [Phytophthora kernoviae]
MLKNLPTTKASPVERGSALIHLEMPERVKSKTQERSKKILVQGTQVVLMSTLQYQHPKARVNTDDIAALDTIFTRDEPHKAFKPSNTPTSMDLSEIPFDVPVILHSLFTHKNLQNPLGSKNARCLGDDRDLYEQLMLRRVRDDKVAIQSVRNGRFLHVHTNGECVFDLKEPGERELFTMETNASCALFFVSCHTGNVLQCDGNGVAKCANKNRQLWEFWKIAEPRAGAYAVQPASAQGRIPALAGKERQDFILELAKYKSADAIEQIVMHLFDAPAAVTSSESSTFAVLVDKE